MTIGKTNRKVCLGETPRPARETSATRKVRCGNATKRKTQPQKLSGLSSGDVLLICSLPRTSPATLAGLTVYPPASQHDAFSARVGVQKLKTPPG